MAKEKIGCGIVWLYYPGDAELADIFSSCIDCRRAGCYLAFLAVATRAADRPDGCAIRIEPTLKPAPLPVYAREEVGFAIGPGYCPCPDDCGDYIEDGIMRELWRCAR